jgi:hypothetical protein
LKGSYVSTGGGGTDYEVDIAAALLARVLANSEDHVLLPDFEPTTVSLQHRNGPLGFDDFVVEGTRNDGARIVTYIQAKRSYSFGDTPEFRNLIFAIWEYLETDTGSWTATIVAGSASPAIADVEALLLSARAQTDWHSFEQVWSADGALNDGKRTFLGAVRNALKGRPEHAIFDVLRRFRAVKADFDTFASTSRQTTFDLLAGIITDKSAAPSLFSELRSASLKDGKIAGSYTRPSLLAMLPSHYGIIPHWRIRAGLAILEDAGRSALSSIASHIAPRGAQQIGLSLLRSQLFSEGQEALRDARVLRIVGEGGAGKSGLLRRLAERFHGRAFVLKDDRVDGCDWPTFVGQLGTALSAAEFATEFACNGPCLLAIDGADRLLLSKRRGIIEDLLAAISKSPLKDRWSILTSARDFQSKDVVADALVTAGLSTGRRIEVEGVSDEDVLVIGEALPTLVAVAARSDLGNRNRILFLLREILSSPNIGQYITEVQLANAWASRGAALTPPDPRRDRALAQISELLLCRPTRRPGRADLDPEGLYSLEREEAVSLISGRDGVLISHDVHEDWLLARAFMTHQSELPHLLLAAEQPLTWLRAMRIYGQTLLEYPTASNDWSKAVALFEATPDLDPAWLRSLMVSPLYSERSSSALDELQPVLLADNGRLLGHLIETLLVAEKRLVEGAATEEAPLQYRTLILRSWGALIRWSVSKWHSWPAALIPPIAQVAHSWCSTTQGLNWPSTKAVVQASLILLVEIEDCTHPDNWDQRRKPFGDDAHRNWRETERLLRNAIARGAAAAPIEVQSYLQRLTSEDRLRNEAGDLIEHYGEIPIAIPQAYTDLLSEYFLKRKRRPRNDGWLIGHNDCFSIHNYHNAGIRDSHGFFPASPNRAGFATLLKANPSEGLRIFHRLEMRSSVYLRNNWSRGERRSIRPVILSTPWGQIRLWGNEFEYQWSRGLLGSNVLGSCYLALDNWIWEQLEAGQSTEELCRTVLQQNGLAATASILICAIALKAATTGVIDSAAIFLSSPRLWDYDARRFYSLRSYPMGFMRRDQHYRDVDAICQRWQRRTFLDQDLILRFHLQASVDAKALLEAARLGWTVTDLATYDDELEDSEQLLRLEQRLLRIRSEADPTNVSFEAAPESGGIKVWIELPEELEKQAREAEEGQRKHERIMTLVNWVIHSERSLAADSTMSLAQAIGHAKELQDLPEPEGSPNEIWHRRKMLGIALVGTAWIASKFGTDELIDQEREWIEGMILAGCETLLVTEKVDWMVDDVHLSMDPLSYGAKGVASLINRGWGSPAVVVAARIVAAGRFTDASIDIVSGIDWIEHPQDAWKFAVIALDRCVHRYARQWEKNQDRELDRAGRANLRLQKQSLRTWRLPWAEPRLPRLPRPVFRKSLRFSAKRRWRFTIGVLKTDWVFQWTRAGKLLTVLNMDAIAADQRISLRFERYLQKLLEWTKNYTDKGQDQYGGHFPFEWAAALATALGRYAAAAGIPGKWRPLTEFQGHNHSPEMVCDYLEAVIRELVESGRAPDDRFWAAWRDAADWLSSQYPAQSWLSDNHFEEWASAPGLMGPYMTPLPPDWPHLGIVLPIISRWAEKACANASAANRLVNFAARFDTTQLVRWLLPWAGLMVKQRAGDREFWGYDDMGDKLATLLEPIATLDATMRTEVRRLISVISDAGSLAAREVLLRLAGQRGIG